MEDLTSRIIKADFSSKKTLHHNLLSRKLSFFILGAPAILYGVYHLYSPYGVRASMKTESGASSIEMMKSLMTGREISIRLTYRPEIYFREQAAYDKLYAERVRSYVGDKKYESFVWE